MLTVGEWCERVAQIGGQKPATMRLIARDYGEADPPLLTRFGRGSKGVKLSTRDGVNLLVGAAIAPPGRATRAINRLQTLPRVQPAGDEAVAAGELTVHDNPLETLVDAVEKLRGDKRDKVLPLMEDFFVEFSYKGSIEFGLDDGLLVRFVFRKTGVLSTGDDSNNFLVFTYYPSADAWTELERAARYRTMPTHHVFIHGPVLIELANVLRGDEPRHNVISSNPSPAPAVPTAGQESESAGGVPTPPAPSRGRQHARRPSAHSSQPGTTWETRAAVEVAQPASARGPFTFFDSEKSGSPLAQGVPECSRVRLRDSSPCPS